MQQGGFLDARQKNPVGLGVVVVLHAAVLTAVILSPPEYIRNTMVHLVTYSVPDDPPPPPIERPKADPKPQPKESHVVQREPIVETPLGEGPTIKLTPGPVDPPMPQEKTEPLPLPVPNPVLVSARPDPRAGEMQPPYPSALARAEIEGKAEVRILIGTDGRVKQVELVSTNNQGFFEATKQQALRHWRFVPATRDGVAIESWRTMTVRFQLQA